MSGSTRPFSPLNPIHSPPPGSDPFYNDQGYPRSPSPFYPNWNAPLPIDDSYHNLALPSPGYEQFTSGSESGTERLPDNWYFDPTNSTFHDMNEPFDGSYVNLQDRDYEQDDDSDVHSMISSMLRAQNTDLHDNISNLSVYDEQGNRSTLPSGYHSMRLRFPPRSLQSPLPSWSQNESPADRDQRRRSMSTQYLSDAEIQDMHRAQGWGSLYDTDNQNQRPRRRRSMSTQHFYGRGSQVEPERTLPGTDDGFGDATVPHQGVSGILDGVYYEHIPGSSQWDLSTPAMMSLNQNQNSPAQRPRPRRRRSMSTQ